MPIIRKGYTCLLAMQILVSSTSTLDDHPAVQLYLSPKQNVCKIITTCYFKWSINCEQSGNILRETEQTCGWVVVVPTTNKFVAFTNRAEGTVLAGQEYSFYVTVHFLCHFWCLRMGLSSELALSKAVVSLFLLNIDLLDLCLPWHVFAVGKRGQYKGKLHI